MKKTELLFQKAKIEETPAVDHVRNLVIASIEAIPNVGGSIASLLESYIPRQKEKRLLDFIESLSEDLEKVKKDIKEDLINKDDFAFILEKTFKGVLDNYQEQKIQCYKAVFINSLTNKDNLLDEQKEIFLNILSNLTVRHLRILAVINVHYRERGNLFDVVKQYCPDYEKDDVIYVMEDLRKYGLVHEKGTVISYEMNANFNQLTVMGKRFVKFIT